MLKVEEARHQILAAVQPLSSIRVDLISAVGHVLAAPIVARRALPPWDNSAMDGYAVRAGEIEAGATLPVSQQIPAGTAPAPLVEGTVARIFTGAPMPPGADSVVMQENTTAPSADLGTPHITFTEAALLGRHVRRRGEDVTEGAEVLSAGRVLAPGDIALAASQGRSQLSVVRPPQVAIVSSGDELVDVDAGPPGPGQIVNSNVLAIAAAVSALGAHPRVLPIIPDDRQATFKALAEAASADVLITSGGVSVGEHDHVGHVIKALAGESFAFWKVAIKPGKPLIFGHIGRCATFGLPGNPVSALVTFELFVKPALLRMMGHTDVQPRFQWAVLDAPLRGGGSREQYIRVGSHHDAEGRLHVTPRKQQSSGALSSIGGADALVRVPIDSPPFAAGDRIEALPL
ncbi:MAG: gephyrin-like molybdotransferase Glp [Bradymonadia bacterium]